MTDKKPKNVFKEGAISTDFIANSIAKHQVKTGIGAHNIFLGQVRADKINNKVVAAIEYTAHEEMANLKFHEIREATFFKIRFKLYAYLSQFRESKFWRDLFVCFCIVKKAQRSISSNRIYR